jgi:tetraacyldisaccharide-1-P 4'-kinase
MPPPPTPEFWARRGLLSSLLLPLAWAYAGGAAARQAWTQPFRASVPVICVGNLVAGGAGKTPVALSLASRLLARGHAVHILSRGYAGSLAGPVQVDRMRHGAAEVGDEPLLLAACAPTWVARDRVAGANAAIAAGAGMLLLDDGLQNPRLAKTLSLLVVDGGSGFGNGRVLPAGPLREKLASGLASADRVVLMGDAGEDRAARAAGGGERRRFRRQGRRRLRRHRPSGKIFRQLGGSRRATDRAPRLSRSSSLSRERVVASARRGRGRRGQPRHHGKGLGTTAAGMAGAHRRADGGGRLGRRGGARCGAGARNA